MGRPHLFAIRFVWYCVLRMLWLGKRRPSRMARNGRPIDPLFADDELLFVRCSKGDFFENGNFKPSSVRVPGQSANREKYPKPRDILLPGSLEGMLRWIFYGIVEISYSAVPRQKLAGDKRIFIFAFEHDPTEENYAHSELRAKEGDLVTVKVTEKVKKLMKTDMAFKMRLRVNPLL